MKPVEIRILFESKFDKGNTELAVICRLCSDTSQDMKNTAAPESSADESKLFGLMETTICDSIVEGFIYEKLLKRHDGQVLDKPGHR